MGGRRCARLYPVTHLNKKEWTIIRAIQPKPVTAASRVISVTVHLSRLPRLSATPHLTHIHRRPVAARRDRDEMDGCGRKNGTEREDPAHWG